MKKWLAAIILLVLIAGCLREKFSDIDLNP